MPTMLARPLQDRRKTLVFLLFVLLITALAAALGAHVGFAWGARLAFLALCALGFPSYSLREKFLLSAALLISAGVWLRTGQWQVMLPALDLAAFFGAFIVALTVMREVAARSCSILKVGRYLISQPPGRRYFATAFGGHVLGVFLNFGAVSLMSPLIQESIKTAEGETDRTLERRQLSALIRGFAWLLLWAPTTLSQAILLTIFTEVTWADIAPIGVVSALAFMLLGRVYDRYEWRHASRTSDAAAPPIPYRALFIVFALCAVLISMTVIGSLVAETSIAVALMCTTPLITLLWHLAQQPPRSWTALQDRLQGLASVLTDASMVLARSAVALGLSGYLGRCLGQAMPTEAIAQAVNLADIPGWLFLAALPVLISLGGQIALSPILLVVFLGEVLRGVEALPTGQMQILFALSVGWALSMTTSPNATATLLISATTRIPPTTLTWKWNLRYGLLCYGPAVLLFALIA